MMNSCSGVTLECSVYSMHGVHVCCTRSLTSVESRTGYCVKVCKIVSKNIVVA